MTITRLGQLTAELNTTQGISLFGGGSSNPVISTTKYKTGARSYRTAANIDPFGISFSTTTAIRAGLWMNHNGASSTYTPPIFTISVGASFVRILWVPNGNYFRLLTGYQQSTTTALSPISDVDAGTFSATDTWRHVGVAYKCDDTSGFISFYVDGINAFSYTGDTTVYKASSAIKEAAAVTGVYSGGRYTPAATQYYWESYAYVDDLYVDSIVGESDVAPSGKRFLFSLADGAGAHTDWTPLSSTNISNVDDPVSSANDGDTTYVKALAANLIDTYTTADITVPVDHIVTAVIPVAIARKTDSTDCTLSLVADDTTDQAVSTAQAMATSYTPVWAYMATQPDGATAWDEAAVNACEFGFKSAGTFA